jgi:hypothetical protein
MESLNQLIKPILSVSRRTDIPAFYGQWFMDRIKEQWVLSQNPFSGQIKKVILQTDAVTAFIFWSKNFLPFTDNLYQLANLGYKSMVHYTITNLPAEVEPSLISLSDKIKSFKEVSSIICLEYTFWRYDPVYMLEEYTHDFHIKNFTNIAQYLEGSTNRCYISFISSYKHSDRRISNNGKHSHIVYPIKKKQELAVSLSDIARKYGITLFSCCSDYLVGKTVSKGKCIDIDLVKKLRGNENIRIPVVPSRKECGCCQVTEIGMYDTCPNGCIYCYANKSHSKAKKFFTMYHKENTIRRNPLLSVKKYKDIQQNTPNQDPDKQLYFKNINNIL